MWDYKRCLFPNFSRPYSYFLHSLVLDSLEGYLASWRGMTATVAAVVATVECCRGRIC